MFYNFMVQIRYVLSTIIGVVFYGKNKYFFDLILVQ